MNALKLLLVLAAACGASAASAQNATTGNATSATASLDNVSLRELVTQAKAAVASNPDLAALFADIGDVNALSDADLAKLVKEILAVTADGSLSTSGSKGNSTSTVGGNSTTTTTAPTVAPVTAPKSAAPVLGLAPAAVATVVITVAYVLL